MSGSPGELMGAADLRRDTKLVRRRRPASSGGVSRRARSTVSIALAGKAAELVTQALMIVLVPRWLGPSAYGDFALALAIVTIGSISLSLGGPEVMARFVPATTPTERAGVARALAARLAVSRVILVALASVVGVALAVGDPGRFPPLPTALVIRRAGPRRRSDAPVPDRPRSRPCRPLELPLPGSERDHRSPRLSSSSRSVARTVPSGGSRSPRARRSRSASPSWPDR